MVMGSKMKHYIKILIILFICLSRSNGSQIWKITTHYGSNLSSTELIEISNDSLHTEMLGSRMSYAVKDIARITYFKSNVNFAMIVGAGTGGILAIGDRVVSGQRINSKRFLQAGRVVDLVILSLA